MIPIRDTIRAQNFPLVNTLLLIINVGVFLVESALGSRALEQKNVNKIEDRTLILADISRKALNQVRTTVIEILRYPGQFDVAKAEELADLLASGTWTHDYPLSMEEARQLGLSVSTGMPEEIYKLMTLYPQTRQQRPSVSYIPIPYQQPEHKITSK